MCGESGATWSATSIAAGKSGPSAASRRRNAESAARLDATYIQALRQAGFQIRREADGNVTVNVSPEFLHAEADGIIIVATNFRTLEVLTLLEQELQKPVMSSNAQSESA